MRNKKGPIGVFDSGLGGLTVVKELIKQLPGEDIIYYGDTARVPYGTKSKTAVIRYSNQNSAILLRRKVKMIVVACNTSSSFAIPSLRRNFAVPIIGVIDPGARKAVERTRAQKIGVIATPATIRSKAYTKSIQGISRSVRVVDQACPLFVPLAEEGWFDNPITHMAAREYLQKMKKAKVDALILGCTHYPLLKTTIKKVMGGNVQLIDSAQEVAREVKRVLEENGICSGKSKGARYRFLVSDEPKHFKVLAKRFLGRDVGSVNRCIH